MRTSSSKAKGRALQDETRDALRAVAKALDLGLKPEDIMSREMGQKGTDVRLSPRAAELLSNPLVECKNCEKLNVVGAFREHQEKYTGQIGLKFLVHTRNKDKASKGKKQPRVVLLDLEDFMGLLQDRLMYEKLERDFVAEVSKEQPHVSSCRVARQLPIGSDGCNCTVVAKTAVSNTPSWDRDVGGGFNERGYEAGRGIYHDPMG